jgi:hypothetical protein
MARKSHPIGIRQALQGLLDSEGLAHMLGEQTLRKAAPLCELISLKDGILHMRVRDSVWRQELHFQRAALIAKANALLGGAVVKDVFLQ